MGEDRLFQAPQRLARLESQLLDERVSSVLVDVKRLRLTAAPVEGEHELPAQTLLQWVLGDERLELPDEVGVPAERQVGVEPVDQRVQAKLLEPTDLMLGERLVGELGERRAAPHRERFAQQQRRALRVTGGLRSAPVRDPLLEPVDVELPRPDAECIASCQRLETAVAQDAAQLGDVVLDDLRRRRRRLLGPELVDQPVRRERFVRVDQQKREQRALLAAADRDLPPVVADLERTEDVEIHLPRS